MKFLFRRQPSWRLLLISSFLVHSWTRASAAKAPNRAAASTSPDNGDEHASPASGDPEALVANSTDVHAAPASGHREALVENKSHVHPSPAAAGHHSHLTEVLVDAAGFGTIETGQDEAVVETVSLGNSSSSPAVPAAAVHEAKAHESHEAQNATEEAQRHKDVWRSTTRVMQITDGGDAESVVAPAIAMEAGRNLELVPEAAVVEKAEADLSAADDGVTAVVSKVVRRQSPTTGEQMPTPQNVLKPSTIIGIVGYIGVVCLVAHRLSDYLRAHYCKEVETAGSPKSKSAAIAATLERFQIDLSAVDDGSYRIGDGKAPPATSERSAELTRW